MSVPKRAPDGWDDFCYPCKGRELLQDNGKHTPCSACGEEGDREFEPRARWGEDWSIAVYMAIQHRTLKDLVVRPRIHYGLDTNDQIMERIRELISEAQA